MKKIITICLGAMLFASCANRSMKVEIANDDPNDPALTDTVDVKIQQLPTEPVVYIMKIFSEEHWHLLLTNKRRYPRADTTLATAMGEVTIKKARVISFD